MIDQSTNLELSEKYRQVIYSKYNIIAHVNFLDFDRDFSILEALLRDVKKDYFEPNDRILVEHFDTDFYLNNFSHGFNLYNLIAAFKNIDIPLFTLLLVTNHFGIKEELGRLLGDDPCPTVIETFISKLHYTEAYQDTDIDADKVIMPAISLMGQHRSHRNALYHFLIKNELLPYIATAIRPPC